MDCGGVLLVAREVAEVRREPAHAAHQWPGGRGVSGKPGRQIQGDGAVRRGFLQAHDRPHADCGGPAVFVQGRDHNRGGGLRVRPRRRRGGCQRKRQQQGLLQVERRLHVVTRLADLCDLLARLSPWRLERLSRARRTGTLCRGQDLQARYHRQLRARHQGFPGRQTAVSAGQRLPHLLERHPNLLFARHQRLPGLGQHERA